MSPLPSAEIVERALGAASADATVVIVSESGAANLRWAGNTLTTNGVSRTRSVLVISVIGHGVGVRATTTVSDAQDIADVVSAAETAAREAGPAEDFGPLVTGGVDADFATPAEDTDIAVLATFANDLGAAFTEARAEGISLYGFAFYDLTTTWLGSSTGLRRRHVQPTGTVEWNAKNGQPGGSVWSGQPTRDFSDVDVAATVADLRTRLGWTKNQIALDPGRYETILPPTAVADLLIYAFWTASGREALEGRTVFSRAGGGTRVGEMLAPAALSLRSNPEEPGLQADPFMVSGGSSELASVFDNGLPFTPTAWIDKGRLANLVETRSSAGKAGVGTAPFQSNLILDGGSDTDLAQMIAATPGPALLLTCLWYIREVDPETLLLTGLTRDGVYLIEGGEVVGAVNNFRFNESPVDLLGRFSEVGASQRTLSREWGDNFPLTKMPPVRVPDFNMSSVSPAS